MMQSGSLQMYIMGETEPGVSFLRQTTGRFAIRQGAGACGEGAW